MKPVHIKELLAKKPRRKYRNVPTVVDNIRFDSKREAARYRELKLLERAGQIGQLETQVPYDLTVNGQKIGRYVADFRYRLAPPKGVHWDYRYPVVEDVKGMKTPVYNLKKKLMRAIHGIEILETK